METEVFKTGGQVLGSSMKCQARLTTAWLTKWPYTHTENVRTEIPIFIIKKTLLKFTHKITTHLRFACSRHAHCLSTVAHEDFHKCSFLPSTLPVCILLLLRIQQYLLYKNKYFKLFLGFNQIFIFSGKLFYVSIIESYWTFIFNILWKTNC